MDSAPVLTRRNVAAAGVSTWPSSNDYTVAVQSPQICFRDSDLKNAWLERNKLTRMPKVWTGNVAQVYELAGRQRGGPSSALHDRART